MTNLLRTSIIAAATGLAFVALPTQAMPISGSVSYSGDAGFQPEDGSNNAVSLDVADYIDFGTDDGTGNAEFSDSGDPDTGDMQVTQADGDLSGFFGADGTIKDFMFDPFSGPISNFFTVTSGGQTLSFELNSVSITVQTADALVLDGQGMLMLTGGTTSFDATPGDFTFTGNTATGGTFSWSASSAAIPAPGALALMGLGLVGLAGLRRRQG